MPKEYKENLMQKYGKDLPVKHVGQPEEIAEAVRHEAPSRSVEC
jgi:hypothetical protein